MKKLIILLCIFPMVSFANSFHPFEFVTKSGNKISLIFKETGSKYSVTYKERNFISSYGQVLTINLNDHVTLVERHTKFSITAANDCFLKVNSKHSWQGKVTEKNYDINFCQP